MSFSVFRICDIYKRLLLLQKCTHYLICFLSFLKIVWTQYCSENQDIFHNPTTRISITEFIIFIS